VIKEDRVIRIEIADEGADAAETATATKRTTRGWVVRLAQMTMNELIIRAVAVTSLAESTTPEEAEGEAEAVVRIEWNVLIDLGKKIVRKQWNDRIPLGEAEGAGINTGKDYFLNFYMKR
jgi:hypothetical protein